MAEVGTISGTTISFATPIAFTSTYTNKFSATFDSNLNKVVVAFRYDDSPSYGMAVVGTVSGTTISFGSIMTFNSGATGPTSLAFDTNANKVILGYQDNGNSNIGKVAVGTVSGTTISFGTAVTFNNATTYKISCAFDSFSGRALVVFQNSNNDGRVSAGVITGTNIAMDTAVVYDSGTGDHPAAVFDSNSNKMVIAYKASTTYGRGVVWTTGWIDSNLTSDNYIGISDGAYANAATATIQVVGATDDAQSGLTTGSKYYVQTDGTLSTTAGDPSVYAGIALSATKLLIKG